MENGLIFQRTDMGENEENGNDKLKRISMRSSVPALQRMLWRILVIFFNFGTSSSLEKKRWEKLTQNIFFFFNSFVFSFEGGEIQSIFFLFLFFRISFVLFFLRVRNIAEQILTKEDGKLQTIYLNPCTDYYHIYCLFLVFHM